MTFAKTAENAGDYDRFVDWDKRLNREGPFFRLLFAEHETRSLIEGWELPDDRRARSNGLVRAVGREVATHGEPGGRNP